MYWRDKATLVAINKTTDGEGYKTTVTARREVFVDVQSARRAEFYTARQTGDRIAAVFLVRAADYHGETRIEHNGKTYDVVRDYTRAGEIYELNCKEAPEERTDAQDGPEEVGAP